MDVADAGTDGGAVVTMCLDGVHNIMEQLPAMKRARSSWVTEALADTTGPPCVWQVCLTVGWNGAPGVWAGGTGAVGNSDGGATWIDLEGGWKHALELLYYSTQSLGEDTWLVVKALGPAAWPRARLQGLGYPNVEYIHAPPGTRQGGDIFQLNTVSGTERTVRCLRHHVGSLVGKVAVGSMAGPTMAFGERASGSVAAVAGAADTQVDSSAMG